MQEKYVVEFTHTVIDLGKYGTKGRKTASTVTRYAGGALARLTGYRFFGSEVGEGMYDKARVFDDFWEANVAAYWNGGEVRQLETSTVEVAA